MCLYNVVPTRTRRPDLKLNRDKHGWYGWKKYLFDDGIFVTPQNFGRDQKMDEWIHCEDYNPGKKSRIYINDVEWYPIGFHVYVKRPRRLYGDTCIIKKVYIKQIVAKGYEYHNNSTPCIVCKKIFIPS